MTICGVTVNFLQTGACYSDSSVIHWQELRLIANQNQCVVDFFSSQSSVLLQDKSLRRKYSNFAAFRGDEAGTSVCCISCAKHFLGNVSNPEPILSTILSVGVSPACSITAYCFKPFLLLVIVSLSVTGAPKMLHWVYSNAYRSDCT